MILAFNLILTSFNVIKAPNVHGKNGFLQSRLTLASPRLLILAQPKMGVAGERGAGISVCVVAKNGMHHVFYKY